MWVVDLVGKGLKVGGDLGRELEGKGGSMVWIEKEEEGREWVVKGVKVREGRGVEVGVMVFGWEKEGGMEV